jgi:hypothetical protein
MKSDYSNNVLEKIPNCIIDSHGVFKYIQILVNLKSGGDSKHVVRGYKNCSYHADNFQEFEGKYNIFYIL